MGGAISLFEPFTDRDVAQVVIPNGDIGVTPFSLKAVVDGQDFSFSGLIQDQVLVAVPEPSAFLAVAVWAVYWVSSVGESGCVFASGAHKTLLEFLPKWLIHNQGLRKVPLALRHSIAEPFVLLSPTRWV